MKTRRTINVDREQAGQLCTKESVFMQMTLREVAGKESSEDGSQSQFISPEDAEGLFKGIITALPTVSEGPRVSAATWVVTDATEEVKRGEEPFT